MKVYTKCPSCRNEIIFRTSAHDRIGFKMIHGDRIGLKCKHCNSTRNYYIADIKAKRSKAVILFASLVFAIGTPVVFLLLWDYIWRAGLYGAAGLISLAVVPVSVYGIINKNDRDRVSSFNRS